MQVAVGYSENADSALAAREAVSAALLKAGRHEICDMVLLFATSAHNQQVLHAEVAALTGNKTAIYGGGAVGIITNDAFGYAGDQVGVACFWLEESNCKVLVQENLSDGEMAAGEALGKQLASIGVGHDSPVMLFYDAMRESAGGGAGMSMATWLLEGLEKGLGCFPNMNGAGLQSDFWGGLTRQYTGSSLSKDVAMALAFSDDVRIDSTIMHGCRPASPYYTVTKAEGPMILEINGEPAIPFIDRLIGHVIKPEQYPFFLLFGINHGERWGEYDENNYASRLCLDIAPERNGIVMFEPDMVDGTEFRLMFRAMDMDYMHPKIDALRERLNGRKPLFGIYINCAGRCSGYNGEDVEDAYVIQKAIGDDFPLLGLYTGVEISNIGGRPRGLDWTGVLCAFSIREKGDDSAVTKQAEWSVREKSTESDAEIPVEAVMKLCEENAAKILKLDTQCVAIRNELELKRRGFRLLSELAASINKAENNEQIFQSVSRRINAALNMQRTAVLLPDENGHYVPTVLQGYSDEEAEIILQRKVFIGDELLSAENPLLVTGAHAPDYQEELRTALMINYFVLLPVVVGDEVTAVLVSGRMVEATPFMSRLTMSDVENVQAISTLLASTLVYERLDDATKRASTDPLTGLLNRRALEAEAEKFLSAQLEEHLLALMVIDLDYFKRVNDTYGHSVGDEVLKKLAETLNKSFRSDDLIARIGGDEFVVICPFKDNVDLIADKAMSLMERWSRTSLSTGKGIAHNTSLSIGISVAPRDGQTYRALFNRADLALYKAKENGRGCYRVYHESMERKK